MSDRSEGRIFERDELLWYGQGGVGWLGEGRARRPWKFFFPPHLAGDCIGIELAIDVNAVSWIFYLDSRAVFIDCPGFFELRSWNGHPDEQIGPCLPHLHGRKT